MQTFLSACCLFAFLFAVIFTLYFLFFVAVSQDTRLGTLSALADLGVLPRALAPDSCGFTCQGATGIEAKQKTDASTE